MAEQNQELTPHIRRTFREYAPILRGLRKDFQEEGYPTNHTTRRLRQKIGRQELEKERRFNIDSVTGLPVRRVFEEWLEGEISRAKRHSRPLTMVLVDINDLKGWNKPERGGYVSGDQALKTVAQILLRMTRVEDGVARYGGDEFSVLLTETDTEGARSWWNRVEKNLQQTPYTVTVCAGEVDLSNPELTRSEIGKRLLSLKEENGNKSNNFITITT